MEISLLASKLNLKFAALQQNINERGVKKEICKESVQSLENINELTKNYTKLQHDFDILHEKYIAQNEEVKLFRNKTNERDTEINALLQLKTTQPLQDFHTLQKEVQSISKQIQVLSLTRHARSDDLQSLYNKTKGGIVNLATEFQNFQSNQSLTLADLHSTISSLDAKFQSSENSLNSSLTVLHQLVDRNSERGIIAY
jgi:predicted  nucleic acid-binding Zn-ribbon protein